MLVGAKGSRHRFGNNPGPVLDTLVSNILDFNYSCNQITYRKNVSSYEVRYVKPNKYEDSVTIVIL